MTYVAEARKVLRKHQSEAPPAQAADVDRAAPAKLPSIPAQRRVKFTGLAQNLGQLQASNRDFQSNLKILG
jgi:hypothetical protein